MQYEFRRLARALPEVTRFSSMGVQEFRVSGKLFATLGDPDEEWGMVKLVWHQQEMLLKMWPAMFRPIPGAWGRRGHTRVLLEEADAPAVREALLLAWQGQAPRSLVAWHRRPF